MLDKVKKLYNDLAYKMPDWAMFTIKVSAISIVWVLLLS